MTVSSVLSPLRYISENAYTARYRLTAKPEKVRLHPLNISDATNYYADNELYNSNGEFIKHAGECANSSIGVPGTPFSAFMEQLVCDYEDMDELNLYATAGHDGNDSQWGQAGIDEFHRCSSTQTTLQPSPVYPALTEFQAEMLQRRELQMQESLQSTVWRSRARRSVPAVRVGDTILPIRVRSDFAQRRRTTDPKALKAAHTQNEACHGRAGDNSIGDEDLPCINSRGQQSAHTKSPLSCSNVMAGLYGIEADHRTYSDSSKVPFEVISSLGHGSLGIVEEVRTSPSKESFVRKRVQIPYSTRAQRLKIVQQEAAVLKSLTHTHIVRILGTYQEGLPTGRHFYSLLMSPVGDNDLSAFLDMVGEKQSRQPRHSRLLANSENFKELTWLKKWFQCLASALAYMHCKGIRHQDIKPSNIVHRGADIYFTDFSSSSPFKIGRTTSTETPARISLMYAAPETVRAPHEESYKRHGLGTDIFSLGCVFMEMLTVLDGRKVQDFHDFCLLKPSTPIENAQSATESARGVLLYSRVTRRTERWFEGAMGMPSAMYQACVKSMLKEDRESRPSAREVLESIKQRQPWKTSEHSCH